MRICYSVSLCRCNWLWFRKRRRFLVDQKQFGQKLGWGWIHEVSEKSKEYVRSCILLLVSSDIKGLVNAPFNSLSKNDHIQSKQIEYSFVIINSFLHAFLLAGLILISPFIERKQSIRTRSALKVKSDHSFEHGYFWSKTNRIIGCFRKSYVVNAEKILIPHTTRHRIRLIFILVLHMTPKLLLDSSLWFATLVVYEALN